MAKRYIEKEQRPYMFDTTNRTLWLMDGDLLFEIDSLDLLAKIRCEYREISRTEAQTLAHKKAC
ncbi:hypothetical protein ACFL43_01185 [Thermodesulfobacteriota bacterium]